MKKRHALLPAIAIVIGMSIGLPAQAHGNGHGHRGKHTHEHRYVYYPERQVYYAPETRTWFWLNGGNWQAGIHLPGPLQVYGASNGIPVVLHSERPYVEHRYVEEHYGRPWRDKHHHKEKKDKHKHKHHKHDHDD